jgi:polysaccharide pyruvyl transferase WcaK-like protein
MVSAVEHVDERAAPRSPIRVGVYGLFGIGNFGNEAALSSVLEMLDNDEYAVTVVTTQGAQRVQAERGVHAVALGRPVVHRSGGRLNKVTRAAVNRIALFLTAFRLLHRLDAVIMAGGGGWEKYGSGTFGTPFEMWSVAFAARALRRPLVLLNVGAEVLPGRIARTFVRHTAGWSTYRSYRDGWTRAAMQKMGADTTGDHVVADIVLSLVPSSQDAGPSAPIAAEEAGALVIVGVMAYFGRTDDPIKYGQVHDLYVRRTKEFIETLVSAGYRVKVIGGDERDVALAVEIRASLSSRGVDVQVSERGDVEGLVQVLRTAKAVVAVRYHNIVMAILAQVPVVSIGYGPKHRELLKSFGLDEFANNIEDFDTADLIEQVRRCESEADSLRAAIGRGLVDSRRRLVDQWPGVEAVLRSGRSRSRVAQNDLI